MLVNMLPDVLKKFQWLKKRGLQLGKRKEYQWQQFVDCLGRHCTSIFTFKASRLRQGVSPNTPPPPPRKKTVLQPGNIQKTCFEGYKYNMCKKNRAPLLYGQAAVGLPVCQVSPLYWPIFSSRKPWFFVHSTESVSRVSHSFIFTLRMLKSPQS